MPAWGERNRFKSKLRHSCDNFADRVVWAAHVLNSQPDGQPVPVA